MTRVLDRAQLQRRVPTGSHTAYALDFTRDAAHIYALWTPRGQCDLLLHFPRDTTVTLDGLFGEHAACVRPAGNCG